MFKISVSRNLRTPVGPDGMRDDDDDDRERDEWEGGEGGIGDVSYCGNIQITSEAQ